MNLNKALNPHPPKRIRFKRISKSISENHFGRHAHHRKLNENNEYQQQDLIVPKLKNNIRTNRHRTHRSSHSEHADIEETDAKGARPRAAGA